MIWKRETVRRDTVGWLGSWYVKNELYIVKKFYLPYRVILIRKSWLDFSYSQDVNIISLANVGTDRNIFHWQSYTLKKLKFSHTRYRALGPKLISVYRWVFKSFQAVGCHYFPPCLRHLPSRRTSPFFDQYQVIVAEAQRYE